jgi:hypothetical protein
VEKPDSRAGESSARPVSSAGAQRPRFRSALEWGERLPFADAGLELWQRDRRVAGNVLAAGLAFRFFLFLLPAALLYSAAVGFSTAADLPKISSRDDMGTVAALASVLASSRGEAHQERWLLVAAGAVLLLYAGWGVSRALIVVHSLVWETRARTPVNRAALATVGVIGILGLTLAGSAIRRHTSGYELAVTVALILAYGGIWLGVSLVLPHRPGSWTVLLPGAVLIGLGSELIYTLNVYLLAPRLAHNSSLYGYLSVVSAIMFGLFILARLIVAAPAANHALWRHLHVNS